MYWILPAKPSVKCKDWIKTFSDIQFWKIYSDYPFKKAKIGSVIPSQMSKSRKWKPWEWGNMEFNARKKWRESPRW